MYLCDYHLHSDFSLDGDDSIQELAGVLLEKGFKEFAVTDHLDVNEHYTLNNFRSFYHPEKYFKELKKIKQKFDINIKSGVEIGQPYHCIEVCRYVMENFSYDFVILSLHTTKKFGDVSKLDYSQVDADEVMKEYFKELYDTLDFKDYDVLGHLDFPKRYMLRDGVNIDMKLYKNEINCLLVKALEQGKGIELNVSGLRLGLDYYLPTFEVLKMYRELGGEIITVGSDGHRISEAGCAVREGYDILRQAGFSYFCTFDKRKPVFYKL